MLALLPLLLSSPADAATLAGVTLSDTATVGGSALILNGIGLREKYTIDVYVAGLYLPTKTTDASTAINGDVAKRMAMVRDLSEEQLAESISEAAARQGVGGEAAAGIAKLSSWMEAVSSGGKIILDYVPGQGTSMTINGHDKGTIPGTATMKAIWSIYLGDPPVTSSLRDGLLGK